jgi:hypothetical protein
MTVVRLLVRLLGDKPWIIGFVVFGVIGNCWRRSVVSKARH